VSLGPSDVKATALTSSLMDSGALPWKRYRKRFGLILLTL